MMLPNSGRSQVQFFDPKKDKEAERKRLVAQQLFKAGEQTPTEMVSGIVVEKSPLEGLAKALTTGLAGYTQGAANRSEDEAAEQRRQLMAQAVGSLDDPRAAAGILLQDPQSADMGFKLYSEALQNERAQANRQAEWARDDRNWERDAALKRQLAAIRANQGGVSFDEETGQLTFTEPQQPDASTGLAPALGVPSVPINTQGLSGKDASTYVRNTRQNADKRLQDEEFIAAARNARNNINDAGRFEELLNVQPTGGWRAIPAIGSIANAFDPETREMKSIQDKLTPQQRQPGSGASSDLDVRMFANALPDPSKPEQTNRNILTAIKAREADVGQYQSFLNDFLQANGHLNGADQAWQQYVNENPIFDPTSNPDNAASVKLNPNRKTYKEFFGAQSPTTQSPQNGARDRIVSHMRSKGANQQQIDAFLQSKGL